MPVRTEECLITSSSPSKVDVNMGYQHMERPHAAALPHSTAWQPAQDGGHLPCNALLSSRTVVVPWCT